MPNSKIEGGLLKPNPKTNDVTLDVPQYTPLISQDEYLTDEQVCEILPVNKQWQGPHHES